MKIREAQIADLQTIVDFQMAMALETEDLVLDKDTLTKGVAAAIEDPAKAKFYVTTDLDSNSKEIVVGCLMITLEWSDWRNGWVWWIMSLYVLPHYRKQGVFKNMYEYIKSLVIANDDIKGLRLYVDKRNVRAQKVYNAIGMCGEHYSTYEWLK